MTLPSFDRSWLEGRIVKPKIIILEVRDKNRLDNKVLGRVFVERQEDYRKDNLDGVICQASITISFRSITGGGGEFMASYSRQYNNVSLTSLCPNSNGAVFIDLPGLYGQRIGSYLMNEIVRWVKQWPEASVNSITLLREQATHDNKIRRNTFYEQFGLLFDYTDSDQLEGQSNLMLARDLITVEKWRGNITEHQVLDYFAEEVYAKEQLLFELLRCKEKYNTLITEHRIAKSNPFRWALNSLYVNCANKIMPLLVIATITVIVFLKDIVSLFYP